jgi:hypothetical protein
MLSALKRFRLLPPLAIWLSASVPAPAQTLHAATRPDQIAPRQTASPALFATTGVSARVADQTPRLTPSTSFAEVRAADLDADGDLDLVSVGHAGLRTWINVSGRFVEHSAARAILQHHTTPGYTTARRASHIEDAVLSAERLALVSDAAPVPFLEARSHVRPAGSSSLSSRSLDAGASRAPPLSARS